MLIAGALLTALLIALTSLIVRDVIRQLAATDDASPSAVQQSPPETTFPRDPSAVKSGHPSSAEWITPDDYPPEAIRAGMQGTVSIRLDISAFGSPVTCQIMKSSGHAVLDNATCALLMKRAHFSQKRDAAGKPIPAQISRRVRWVLPE